MEKAKWKRLIGGALVFLGFVILFAAAGTSDYQTMTHMLSERFIPFRNIFFYVALGAALILGGAYLLAGKFWR